MAQVLPAERDLRRVIGDADGVGDREVEGLGEQELLDLYRSLVLLRTYDERSVVYHRQGRIGTYAIFWNNNQWAISTPLEAQTRAEALADKAVGYGMPGVRVDGTDVLAVYEATRDAVARARNGDGPTFVEAVTYRAAPHATADDPRAYIDLERVEEERKRECVGRYEAYVERLGVLDAEQAEAVRAEAQQLMPRGIGAAVGGQQSDASV